MATTLIACLGLLLAGCAAKPKKVAVKSPKPLTTAQLRQHKIKYLRQQGVQVIQAGQDITLVFPSDELFNANSASIDPGYTKVLRCAAKFIRSYDKVTVRVRAYSNSKPAGPKGHKKALTRAQAQTVEKYLWRHGINARLLVAYGRGARHPVASNHHGLGQSVNRRVEVSFRFYPKFNYYY